METPWLRGERSEMRIVVNEKYISRRATAGRYLSLAGLLILLVAFIFSWIQVRSSVIMPLTLGAALVLGIFASFIGGYYLERFAGPTTAHHIGVRESLKGLDDRYVLFQYVLPVPHVLLGPRGLTVIVVRSQPGEIRYADGRWTHRQRGKFFRELAGQERLGRPEVEVEEQVERMRRHLEKRLPEVEVPIEGVVLFINPEARVEAKDLPVPVFFRKKVKEWLRLSHASKSLPAAVRERVEEVLLSEVEG